MAETVAELMNKENMLLSKAIETLLWTPRQTTEQEAIEVIDAIGALSSALLREVRSEEDCRKRAHFRTTSSADQQQGNIPA